MGHLAYASRQQTSGDEAVTRDAEARMYAEREALFAVVKAARALRAKLEECQPYIDSAIMIATMNHCPWEGPNYGADLDALDTALAGLDREDDNG
jgi:hypothetical protein